LQRFLFKKRTESNLRRLRLGEEKKKEEERRTNHSMKIYIWSPYSIGRP